MKTGYFVLAIVASMGLMAAHVSAATTFSDNFTGGPSANWANPEAADYTNDNAAFLGVADDGRDYLHTVDADYFSENFIATVDLTNGSTFRGVAFFGMGEGTPGAGSPHWWEPKNGSYVFARLNTQDLDDAPWVTQMGDVCSNLYDNVKIDDGGILPEGSTIRVQLIWEASTCTATFRFDSDYNGTYDFTHSTVNTDLSTETATSRLFAGGANGVIVDNFSVIVDPVLDPFPGDADRDGDVDADDAAALASNWQSQGLASWAMGDFNSDGKVDDIDATLLATNWSSEVASVPEPSTFVLLSMGLLGVFVTAWRKKRLA